MNEGNAIMELARQANLPSCHLTHPKALARFAALVRAAALEEAAEFVDRNALHCHDDGLLQVVLKSQAAAIRKLKDKP